MTRTVKKPSERHKEIIDLATKLFWEKDYEKTSMNQIVSELGIAKGTVYHYFKSKEELMFAVIEKEVKSYVEMVQEEMKKAPKDAVKKFIYLINLGQKTETSKIDHLHRPGNNILHTRLLARLITEFAPIYAKVIEEGCNEGAFKVKHPLETAELLLSSSFMVDVGFFPWDERTLERRTKAYPSLIEAQLGASPNTFKNLKV